MAHYLITYDNRPPRNYQALYGLMGSMGAVRLADSVWLVELGGSAAALTMIVGATLEPDDRLAVIQLMPGSDWRTQNVSAQAVRWLSDHIATADIFMLPQR